MRRRSEPDRAEPPVLYDLLDDGTVAVVTLNRPQRLNAYDVSMRDGLYEALLAVRDDPGVRAMVLCGNGRAFCSGGDVAEFGSAPSPSPPCTAMPSAADSRWRCSVINVSPAATHASPCLRPGSV